MIQLGNQAIVLQGPTDYGLDTIINFYSQFDNVVWSTWSDIPDEHKKKLIDSGIPVLFNEKPKFNGHLNVNMQLYSTFKGVEYFLDKNIDSVIKIRSDMVIEGVERLLHKLRNQDISFMAMHNKDEEFHKPKYYLDYWHEGMDFPADFIIFGNIHTMLNVFNYQMEYYAEVPPESIILGNYLRYKGKKILFEYYYLQSIGIDFFIKYATECNFRIFSLKHKHNLTDIVLRYKKHCYLF